MSDTSGGWFLTHGDGEVHGPFDLAALLEAARRGNIASETQLRHFTHTRDQWLPANRIRPIAEVLSERQPVAATPTPKPAPQLSRTPTQPIKATNRPAEVAADLKVDVETPRSVIGRRALTVPETFGAAFLALFDFRFRYFITPWIVKITWGTCVVVTLIWLVIFTIGFVIQPLVRSAETGMGSDEMVVTEGVAGSPARSRGSWEFQPPSMVSQNLGRIIAYATMILCYGFGLLYLRVLLELAMVMFRISTDLSELKNVLKES